MAPIYELGLSALRKRLPLPASLATGISAPTRASLSTEGGFLEAWAQGYNVGSLVILILIVVCNYRSGIWLHKLILLEVRRTVSSTYLQLLITYSLFLLSGMVLLSSSTTQRMAGISPQPQLYSLYLISSTTSSPG
jgi:hypothetical protein